MECSQFGLYLKGIIEHLQSISSFLHSVSVQLSQEVVLCGFLSHHISFVKFWSSPTDHVNVCVYGGILVEEEGLHFSFLTSDYFLEVICSYYQILSIS